jgi:hypothetical protein
MWSIAVWSGTGRGRSLELIHGMNRGVVPGHEVFDCAVDQPLFGEGVLPFELAGLDSNGEVTTTPVYFDDGAGQGFEDTTLELV